MSKARGLDWCFAVILPRINSGACIHDILGQWEMLPHDFPPYTTVYGYFRKWHRRGIWVELHDELRHQVRMKMGRKEDSSVAIADSQSVKTTEKKGPSTVMTVAKKLKDVNAILS